MYLEYVVTYFNQLISIFVFLFQFNLLSSELGLQVIDLQKHIRYIHNEVLNRSLQSMYIHWKCIYVM